MTILLALGFYPSVFEDTAYRDDNLVHWVLAAVSGTAFFVSIVLHELAHSVVALKQGIPVKNITLFIFGGVSQIGGEARRPLHEFIMAVIGPLTSLALAGIFFVAWWITGFKTSEPVAAVVWWLFVMNLILAAFNMAPGFPMDGGRVLRSIIWGVTGNSIRATRIATLAGRGLGYGMMVVGGLAIFGTFGEYISRWSGVWFIILGTYLENSAKQSWFQAKAIDVLGRHFAEDLMHEDLETAGKDERLHYLASRGGPRYIFFITDENEKVVGVLTQREVEAVPEMVRGTTTAGEAMRPTAQFPVAMPREDAASMLQRMEEATTLHMPVVRDGRVVGVVAKEDLLRLLAQTFFPEAAEAPPLPR
ncbi:MAG TPA: site-2 protease family protein [Dehalococcoidia bacterium]|nr:site-2 protease family protein [Dehalococcoidia bacterium]